MLDSQLTAECRAGSHGNCNFLLENLPGMPSPCQCWCHRQDFIDRMGKHILDRRLFQAAGSVGGAVDTAEASRVSPPAVPSAAAPSASSSSSTRSPSDWFSPASPREPGGPTDPSVTELPF